MWLQKKEFEAMDKLSDESVSGWDKENIWDRIIDGLNDTTNDLDEVEGHLETAKDLFSEFLREHNIKVGGS